PLRDVRHQRRGGDYAPIAARHQRSSPALRVTRSTGARAHFALKFAARGCILAEDVVETRDHPRARALSVARVVGDHDEAMRRTMLEGRGVNASRSAGAV